MTNEELDNKISQTMATLRANKITLAITKAWNDYAGEVKKEALKSKKKSEKLAHAVERLMESGPCELYCYVMFDDEGDLRGWTIDHQQYWQGNSGPSSAIAVSPGVTYEDIEREIGNDLAEALDIDIE
jgi:hypothetical protein